MFHQHVIDVLLNQSIQLLSNLIALIDIKSLKERKNVFRSFEIQIELSLRDYSQSSIQSSILMDIRQQIFNLFKVIIYHLSVL